MKRSIRSIDIWPFLFCIRIENFEGAHTGQTFLEISNGRKTARMAPIFTIFGPNASQRCQLKFEKNLGRRKNFREGEKFEKLLRKVRKNFGPYTVFGTKQNRNGHVGRRINAMLVIVRPAAAAASGKDQEEILFSRSPPSVFLLGK